jgi:hypothetical protein
VFRGPKTLSPATPGYVAVTAADLKLATVTGAVAAVGSGAVNGFYLAAATVSGGEVRITGLSVVSSGAGTVPTFQVWGSAGTLEFTVIGVGTPLVP